MMAKMNIEWRRKSFKDDVKDREQKVRERSCDISIFPTTLSTASQCRGYQKQGRRREDGGRETEDKEQEEFNMGYLQRWGTMDGMMVTA